MWLSIEVIFLSLSGFKCVLVVLAVLAAIILQIVFNTSVKLLFIFMVK